jgi:aminopeptidase N
MRQLEELLGADEMRDGLREYLTRFAFANATWEELVEIFDTRTDEDLASWSRAWVNEPGRPTVTTNVDADGQRLARLTLTQSDPRGRSLIWNQRLQVALGYESGARITPVRMNGSTVDVPRVADLPLPRYILPNGEGSGYGLFKLDPASRTFFLNHLPDVGDRVTRASAWITLWDDMLEAGARPSQLIDLALRALPEEPDEQIVQRVLGYATQAYWRFLGDPERRAVADRIETTLRSQIAPAQTTSLKSAYFSAFQAVVTTEPGLAYLERVWRRQEPIPGLSFAETDYISMAQELALRAVSVTNGILTEQLGRITNPDRKARFAFVTPALSPDLAVRDAFFSSLARLENRSHEPWVRDALRFLNHPLRRTHAERYIRPSLDLLHEIQRTGDIFFPTDWTSAALDGHNTTAAAETVREFLAAQKDYPPRLRQIVEQSADPLFRAARIVIK